MVVKIKRLYRSRNDKVIAGVCGGIGEAYNIDPLWIRLIAALLVLADGVGLIIYIVAWISMPENPQQTGKKTEAEKAVEKASPVVQKTGTSKVLGIICIIIGAGLMFRYSFSWFSFKYIWPLVVIGIGVYLLVQNEK